MNALDVHSEVLSPWAEVDVPLRGISPRLIDLNGKTIGLFVNAKVAAPVVQTVVEGKLKERFPAVKFSRFLFDSPGQVATNSEYWGSYKEWLNGVDTVIGAVGD